LHRTDETLAEGGTEDQVDRYRRLASGPVEAHRRIGRREDGGRQVQNDERLHGHVGEARALAVSGDRIEVLHQRRKLQARNGIEPQPHGRPELPFALTEGRVRRHRKHGAETRGQIDGAEPVRGQVDEA
jgi:hypothetical protein